MGKNVVRVDLAWAGGAGHVAEAKRADTKARRIDKILPMIRSGAGLHDRYR